MNNEQQFLSESKIICKFENCIYNNYKECRRTEITIDKLNNNPTCFDYKKL